MVVGGRILGVAMLAGATVYGIKRGGALGGLGGLAAGIGGASIGYRVIDKARGQPLPFLPGAEQLLQPTLHVGQVAAGLKRQFERDDYAQRIERTNAMLREAGNLIELSGEVV